MDNTAWFLILGLAVWRVSSLLVNEAGPFEVFAKFRHFIGVTYNEYSVAQGKNEFAKVFTCVWCLSVWLSFVAAIFTPYKSVIGYFASALALSAITIIIDRIINGQN